MKICLISDEHFPHRGADTEVIVNTAAALGAAGADVHLLTPHLWHKAPTQEELCAYYGVPQSFTHHPLLNPLPPERVVRSQQLTHSLTCLASKHFWTADVVHTRDHAPLALAHLLRRPWCYETYRRHALEKPWLAGWLRRVNLARGVGAVCHTEQSRQDLISLGFAPEATLAARPGFNLDAYTRPAPLPGSFPSLPPDAPPLTPSDEARRRVRLKHGLAEDLRVVGYVGNIGPGKGVDACVRAMRAVEGAHLLVVGGSPEEVARLEGSLEPALRARTTLVGHVPSSLVPHYMSASDLLVIPPLERNSRGWLLDRLLPPILPGTPLKIYGYWASRRLCVAADQPHNTELLSHLKTAVLYDPARPEAFGEAVGWALGELPRLGGVVEEAYAQVLSLTYQERARRMLGFYEGRLGSVAQGA